MLSGDMESEETSFALWAARQEGDQESMHVLVVGGNGFIGSHIVDALLADKVQVTVLDVSPERFGPLLPEVHYCPGSFGDADDIERALKGKPNAVIHLGNYGLTLNAT